MARHVLIIEKSPLVRRVLQARILAVLDDVILSEAAGLDEAEALLEKSTIHLVLYGWEGDDDERGLEFCCQHLKNSTGEAIPFVWLVAAGEAKGLPALVERRIENYVRMPCSADELAAAIDRACHPSSLRENKRYCISGTRGVLEQRSLSISCTVLNVSIGGMLCEFEMDGRFNCIDPVMISAQFGTGASAVGADEMYAVISNMKVIDSNSDYTPRLVRMGFRFLQIPDAARHVLMNILDQAADEDEDSD